MEATKILVYVFCADQASDNDDNFIFYFNTYKEAMKFVEFTKEHTYYNAAIKQFFDLNGGLKDE